MNTLVLDRMAREHGRTLALLTGFRTRLRTVLPSDGRTFLFQSPSPRVSVVPLVGSTCHRSKSFRELLNTTFPLLPQSACSFGEKAHGYL